MKYFQPELLSRYRSADDDVADAAAAEWEEACAAYRARFQSLRARFPLGVRRLCSRVSLHDARVLGAAWSERKPLFGLLLRLEGQSGESGEVLQLNYHPVAGPKGGVHIRTHGLAGEIPRSGAWILHDEFDLDEEYAFFNHSLLLTDGREIAIRFHSLTVRRLGQVFTPNELPEGQVKWPLAETSV